MKKIAMRASAAFALAAALSGCATNMTGSYAAAGYGYNTGDWHDIALQASQNGHAQGIQDGVSCMDRALDRYDVNRIRYMSLSDATSIAAHDFLRCAAPAYGVDMYPETASEAGQSGWRAGYNSGLADAGVCMTNNVFFLYTQTGGREYAERKRNTQACRLTR